MNRFIESNPGLRSRFQRYITFADYDVDQLALIFERRARDLGIEVGNEVAARVRAVFEHAAPAVRGGNGRFVRNLFEEMYGRMALRINADGVVEAHELAAFEPEDVPDAGSMTDSFGHRPGGAGYL